MKTTSLTILQRVKTGSSEACVRLDEIYRPFIRGWFQHRRVPHDVAEDLTQQVMMVLARELPDFDHSGRTGAFRHWLRRIAIFEEKAYWRRRSVHEQAAGGTAAHEHLEQLEDPGSDLAQIWDQQHDLFVLKKLLDDISHEFQVKSMIAFQRLALEGDSAARVAKDLDMSVGAVYVAKSRVTARLREEAEGLVEDESFSRKNVDFSRSILFQSMQRSTSHPLTSLLAPRLAERGLWANLMTPILPTRN